MRITDWLIEKAYAADNLIDFPTGNLPTGAGEGVDSLVERVYAILIALAYPLAVAAIIYSAYLLITSTGNPDAYVKAKKNIIYLTVGIFFIIFAVIMVNFFAGFFVP